MLLKVEADSGYGSMLGPGPGLAGSLGTSETLPLLIPEDEPELHCLKPMTREELEAAAGGPGWKKFHSCLVLLFWLGWLTTLSIAIIMIVQSPRPVPGHLHWWQKELVFCLEPALFLDVESTGSGTISSMRVILDLCKVDNNKTESSSNASDYVQDSLRYWLELGVSGFELCSTDPAFTEKTQKRWKEVVKEFGTDDNERNLMLREIRESLPGLNISKSAVNRSLVKLLSRSLIPPSSHPLSAPEVAKAMASKLKTLYGEWPGWGVDGPVAWKLRKVIMVLMMTLPGMPIIRYGDEISQAPDLHHLKHSTALLHALSLICSHEEALLRGTITFLTFNSTSLLFGSTNPTATPPMAFLHSWGCVHFLVLFNLGSEPHALDSKWTLSLPESGMFVTSTGLDRFGPVTLQSITLQPHEAIVIKLFETDPNF